MDVVKRGKKILFITYDGLTDSLGQSQILPYLKGLSTYGYRFTILSFEKPDRFQKGKEAVESLMAESDMTWVPLSFTSKPPLLSKFYDAVRMKQKATQLHRKHNYDMVHCRSYLAADVGLYLKRKFGVKFFFDMRGFWADEKKDGTWNMANPLFKIIYRYYKNKEAQFLRQADYVISLTEAAKNEMQQWECYNSKIPMRVIPCCADMSLFSLVTPEEKRIGREKLNITDHRLVISYLGSVGTWYMLDKMLLFFKQLKQKYPNALFLIISHSAHALIMKTIRSTGLNAEDIIIRQASRKEVPLLIKASDINISFVKPVYSKISTSPTKLGEVLSMGIPVIYNAIGDVEVIIKRAKAGYVLYNFNEDDFDHAINDIPHLLKKDACQIRNAIKDVYDLTKGVELYAECYKQILND